ncbi:MAG: response regulator, partial [Gammaproteobacteria bacterium]|nr:response regulator [Gammaproteobacteria bacterium]
YAVFEALKADPKTKDIPVIALSADAMPIDIERGLKAGFMAYLTKPVKVEELMEAVKNFTHEIIET